MKKNRSAKHNMLGWILLGLFSLSGLLSGVAYVAYRIGKTQSSFNAAIPSSVHCEDERKLIDTHLSALTQRVGSLQTELLKLDTLGKQLAHMSQIDKNEFNFTASWNTVVTEQQLIEAEEGNKFLALNTSHPQLAALNQSTQQISYIINDRQEKFALLEGLLLNRRIDAKVLPSGWPLKQGYVSSGFGWRGVNQQHFHSGVDLIAQENAPVLAVEDGIVTKATIMGNYGNVVEIRHGNTYSTRYAHNSRNLVTVGERVSKGQPVALVGSTGRATTAHVHFELLEGDKPINPVHYLNASHHVKLSDNIRLSER